MYSQFFGNYLLSKHAVPVDKLLLAIEEHHTRHLKLGTLAIHAGLLNAAQVEEILKCQLHKDKRFGELAIELEYLTQEQVDSLLKQQTPDYLLIGQSLVENGVLSTTKLEELIASYQKEDKLSHLETTGNQKENLHALIRDLFLITVSHIPDYLTKYLGLLFNDLIRFIGGDFMPLNPTLCSEYVTHHCAAQIIDGEFSLTSYLNIEEETAIAFAARYAKIEYKEYNEYVQASLDDFLNLHNGLFTVNISNADSIELTLNPIVRMENTLISSSTDMILLPIVYPFGTLNFFFKL